MINPPASDAAIARVVERWNKASRTNYYRTNHYECGNRIFTRECDREQALSDALRAEHGGNVPASLEGFVLPPVVDPIVAAARRICEAVAHEIGAQFEGKYADGTYDNDDEMQFAIAELRAIAAQGGGE